MPEKLIWKAVGSMKCTLAELRYKEVIDIANGCRYGYVGDVELDVDSGQVRAIIIPGRPRWLGLLGHTEDLVFPWPAVKRFGEDIILVDGSAGRGV